jgi:hypothetical protein
MCQSFITVLIPSPFTEKNSKTNPYDKLSVLDKILQNIGRSSGNFELIGK